MVAPQNQNDDDQIQGESDNLSEMTSWVGAALPSEPVTLINIPEPKSVLGKFVYNFYTRDERTNGNGTLAIDLANPSQEQQNLAKSRKFPRYVRLSIQPTSFGSKDPMLVGIANQLGSNLINDHKNLIQFEGAIASNKFAGIRLQDNQVDQSFYYALSSSVAFFGIDTSTSGNSISTELNAVISSSAAFGPSGLQIRDSLSNIQSQGVSYAPTDVRNAIANDAFRSVRFIDFNMNINNKVISNILQGSVEDKTNIYEDELESMAIAAKNIQSQAVIQSNPTTVSADEYETPVSAIDVFTTSDSSVSSSGNLNEGSLAVGYWIEKFELVMKPDGNYDRVNHDPLIVNHYGPLNILDTSVKYGGTYLYNVRTVALTRFEALKRDETANVEDEIVVAVIMIASSGVMLKVQCTENIPPDPPGNISFKYDYQNDNLMIFWEEPLNPQRDVVRYQIFRRNSIDVPFTLIREFDFDKSTSRVQPVEVAPEDLILKMNGARKFFRDLEFTKTSKYIYSITCVDARGFTSNYSSQFEVSFSVGENKLKTKLVSKKDAPKPYPNLYLNQDLFVDTMKDSGHSRLRIFFDPEYYDVFRTTGQVETFEWEGKILSSTKQTQSLNLIGNNYKLQIINVDNQMSQLVSVAVNDLTGSPIEIPANQGNLSSVSSMIQSELNST